MVAIIDKIHIEIQVNVAINNIITISDQMEGEQEENEVNAPRPPPTHFRENTVVTCGRCRYKSTTWHKAREIKVEVPRIPNSGTSM